MSSLRELKLMIINKLCQIYDEHEAKSITKQLIEDVTGLKYSTLILKENEKLSTENIEEINKKFNLLLKSMPYQYVHGKAHFYGREFFVSQDVLIPRPVTEEMTDLCIKTLKKNKDLKITELCTGSGVIAISLAKELNVHSVTATDISGKAIEIAKKNAIINSAKVDFLIHDVFNSDSLLPDNQDCIISNPPYVTEKEKKTMHKNVLDYEPPLALFVSNDDPVVFYRRIAEIASNKLKVGGILWCEINTELVNETKKCFVDNNFGSIFVLKDLLNNNRILKAVKQKK